jgi:hypothetical protein
MKKIIVYTLLLFCTQTSLAQTQTKPNKSGQKVVEGSKKINDKTKEYSETSLEATENIKQSADNLKSVANNLKGVVMIFEPITKLHFFKKKNNKPGQEKQSRQAAQSDYNPNNSETPPPPPPNENNYYNNEQGNSNQNITNGGANSSNNQYNNFAAPENSNYNEDGTLNCGHQKNSQYGNCIDLLQGTVVGMGEAAENPSKIDLIFFAQYDGLSYSLYSPYEAANGLNEGNWGGVGAWRDRNETEIAQTKLTIGQFEKIQTNTQLLNVVKNTTGYSGYFYTPNKMDGRVFAVKLMQDNRELNALLAVYKQYGGGGGNGYLKIKIKVQAIDNNRDGYVDDNAYNR